MRLALVDADGLGSSLAALLDNTRIGVVQLDRSGRIVEANDRALELLRRGDGLVDRGGSLHAFSRADDAELQRLLTRALPSFGRQGVSGSMVVGHPLLLPRLALHISPTVEGQPNVLPRRVAALVLVVDPARRVAVDPSLVAAALGLTQAESHIAVLLAEGNTVRDIAIATGRTETHHPLARQTDIGQARYLPADGVGATGAAARRLAADSAVTPARRGLPKLTKPPNFRGARKRALDIHSCLTPQRGQAAFPTRTLSHGPVVAEEESAVLTLLEMGGSRC